MIRCPRVLSLASAAALALALGHTVMAEEAAAPPASAAPVVEAAPAPAVVAAEPSVPAAPAAAIEPAATADAPAAEATAAAPAEAEAQPAPEAQPAAEAQPRAAQAAQERSQARRAEMAAERNQRYQELRERAAEVGLELPETPPWESAAASMPAPPTQMRQGPAAMRERMKTMTPEDRKVAREARWKEMREIAAQRGVELPETPPWVEAEARYKAAQEQFEKYRKTVEEMSEEQVEAARAIFGRTPRSGTQAPMGPRMGPNQGPMSYSDYGMGQRPQGGYPQGGYPQGGYPQGGYPQRGHQGYGMPSPMSQLPMMSHPGSMDVNQMPLPPQGAGY